jgi:hypothetical protein
MNVTPMMRWNDMDATEIVTAHRVDQLQSCHLFSMPALKNKKNEL